MLQAWRRSITQEMIALLSVPATPQAGCYELASAVRLCSADGLPSGAAARRCSALPARCAPRTFRFSRASPAALRRPLLRRFLMRCRGMASARSSGCSQPLPERGDAAQQRGQHGAERGMCSSGSRSEPDARRCALRSLTLGYSGGARRRRCTSSSRSHPLSLVPVSLCSLFASSLLLSTFRSAPSPAGALNKHQHCQILRAGLLRIPCDGRGGPRRPSRLWRGRDAPPAHVSERASGASRGRTAHAWTPSLGQVFLAFTCLQAGWW
jgi:hypothetical protein